MSESIEAEALFEATFESSRACADPFNDAEVDVIFSREGQTWRVPTFWRGANRWTVRFAPSVPGQYQYRLESTGRVHSDLDGRCGELKIAPYCGSNPLLRHGALKVSANQRYFEHADGSPFYWLADTWWTGLSDRLSWEGFRTLTADRKAKGFTVVQLVAGLVPVEELAPVDPGFCNEGGPVWDARFERINPGYFDYCDRRVLHLIEAGLLPAIVGAWGPVLRQMGLAAMKRHWRYIIARYGAYPVCWIAGGEIVDPPEEQARGVPEIYRGLIEPGWTEVVRYIRTSDPHHRLLTAHEVQPPADLPVRDESLTDFDLFQSGHFGAWSLATLVAQFNRHYARTSVRKPLVQGEVGYERLGGIHLEDFQRMAFWLSMLNGAAGHTYGADGVFECYTADKPLHRQRWSFLSWEEGMNLPGSYQVGLGAKLLRRYQWWRFEPHPEWVTPRGTTLLQPQDRLNDFDLGIWENAGGNPLMSAADESENVPKGTFRQPYAAGIPREVRIVYIPSFAVIRPDPPTILELEEGVRYRAYFWQPVLGIRLDLGVVQRPSPGEVILSDAFTDPDSFMRHPAKAPPWLPCDEGLRQTGWTFSIFKAVQKRNCFAAMDVHGTSAALILRYSDEANFVAAVFRPADNRMYLMQRKDGVDTREVGATSTAGLGSDVRLCVELRDDKAMLSASHGELTIATPIVDIDDAGAGSVGFLHSHDDKHAFSRFELRESPTLLSDVSLERELYDAKGLHRGRLSGASHPIRREFAGWDGFGQKKHILLNAYRPERLPASGDWVLILGAVNSGA